MKKGGVGSEVTITLPGGHELVAMITRESCNDLGLNVGSAVIALIKSTAIIIATDADDFDHDGGCVVGLVHLDCKSHVFTSCVSFRRYK